MANSPSAAQVKFEAVFYGSEAPLVILKGADLIYEMYNQTYQSIYPGRQLLGKSILEVVPELIHSPFPHILKKVYDTGESFVSHEGMVNLKNPLTGKNEERFFDTTFSRIDYGDGQQFRILAMPKEVTDKVQARKKLEQSLRELEAERELREKFVSALTHDLRTPLAVVKISAQTLKSKPDNKEVFEKCTDRILNNVERSDRMIRDLLDANRLKANEGLPLFIQECQLDDIIQVVIRDLEDIYGKRFSIHNKIGNITVHCDNMAVHRMIENLASNAIKYGSEDGSVTIEINSDDQWLEISVHNLGNPISSEDQKMLFHTYHRTEFARSSHHKGWGIGLSLVQGLAQAHGGSASLKNSSAEGTTFTIRIPIKPLQ